ncbi:hypothetical protein [Faecalibacillus intestinalis]|uniref:hypothetical protein n=1 Tax=Faecalibacillus intestinalis TaxID=1982626 RepID=UPI00295F4D9F|nr:hypothetical protein [Faecalibacillus intestinalis]
MDKSHIEYKIKENPLYLNVPIEFDIFENQKEVLMFFEKIKNHLNEIEYGEKIIFDFSEVERISIDAVMYMIAFAKKYTKSNISYGLTKPKNKKCNRFFLKCGIGKFLKERQEEFEEDVAAYHSIVFGNTVDGEKAKSMSDFCHEKMTISPNIYKFIYKIIIELMNNTVQHAYKNDSSDDKLWFTFIEDTVNKIKITFFDMGIGIPATVKKYPYIKGTEKTGGDLNALIKNEDSFFIESSLKGDINRSQTEQANRGRGLPEIYGYYKDNYISNLKIASGRGICKFFDSNRLQSINQDCESSLEGTLFYWELDKKILKKGGF